MQLKDFFVTGNLLGNDSSEWLKKATAVVFCVEWSQVTVV